MKNQIYGNIKLLAVGFLPLFLRVLKANVQKRRASFLGFALLSGDFSSVDYDVAKIPWNINIAYNYVVFDRYWLSWTLF
jgi:hypothetical protein